MIRLFPCSDQMSLTLTSGMATSSEAAKPAEVVLEWPKKDKKRFLHAVYRVGDLDRTIKYVVVLSAIFAISRPSIFLLMLVI